MSAQNKITIVVHNGQYHSDDIFAVAVLLSVLGEENVQVIRTRDEKIIESADYVADVGGIYDPEKNRFDHHQKEGAGVRPNGIPYASFGLVWKKWGEELSGSKEVAEKVEDMLVTPTDALDNGVSLMDAKFEGIYPYDIYSFFQALAPSWKEDDINIDDVFMHAVSYAKIILNREIKKRRDFFEVKDVIVDVYNSTEDKRVIVFDRHYPTGEVLAEFPEPLYVLFPNQENNWVVKAIRDNNQTFVYRKNLPESWAGKRDRELEEATGVEGSIFCHRERFIAVAKTKEAALKLAEIALNS